MDKYRLMADKWISDFLSEPFPGRSVVWEQINNALITVVVEYSYVSVEFLVDKCTRLLPGKYGTPSALVAPPNGSPLLIVLHSSGEVITELEIITADATEIDIFNIDLSDIEYYDILSPKDYLITKPEFMDVKFPYSVSTISDGMALVPRWFDIVKRAHIYEMDVIKEQLKDVEYSISIWRGYVSVKLRPSVSSPKLQCKNGIYTLAYAIQESGEPIAFKLSVECGLIKELMLSKSKPGYIAVTSIELSNIKYEMNPLINVKG